MTTRNIVASLQYEIMCQVIQDTLTFYDSLAEALAGVVAPEVITIIRETESNRDVAISDTSI